jgi:DNA-binding NtrC family response regulator
MRYDPAANDKTPVWSLNCSTNSMNKTLIVDDEETIRFAMSVYFTTLGCSVDCAESVEEANAFLSEGPYSAVIADLRLSGSGDLGGGEVIDSVRERFPATPVIVLSACTLPDIEQEVLRRGASVFLHKPTPLPEVAEVVLALIEAAGEKSRTP